MSLRLTAVLALVALAGAACTAAVDPSSNPPAAVPSVEPWPAAPPTADEPLDPAASDALDRLVDAFTGGTLDADALTIVAASGDARLGWVISDMLRFAGGGSTAVALVEAFTELTGVDPLSDERFGSAPWLAVTNLLIAWDLPAPPGYRETKAELFLPVEPAWGPFFADADAAIDWRLVSWGGVLIDDREVADRRPCSRGCIPALDDPALTPAAEGDWYADDRTVFGVVVNGEAVAFPKHIMEVHEMVNLTIGGRRIGMPYCTLCGAAQAYLTDAVPDGVETPILRTSGLLSRSNKVMYDLVTDSVFNTFTGRALSGPLQDVELVLEPVTVVVTTWGEWRQEHPDTRIVAKDGGIGRSYPDDPLGDRDADGPIFPIGQADPRLPAQAQVLGVIAPDGRPLAFPVDQAKLALADEEAVAIDDVEVVADGGGLRARLRDGTELSSSQAFWFAWSQFHPDTALWTGIGG
jgi:hypothetical protein